MSDDWKEQKWAQDFWYSGKVTRRKLIGYGAASAGALGATMLVPAPWRAAFGQAKPYKIGTLQPLSGTAAAGGKTALVGVQMAVDRINKSGGINGRPVELLDPRLRVQARRRPPQGREAGGRGQDRRPRRRLPLQRLPRLHAGVRRGQDRQHDQRVPRHHDHHQQVQPLHLPARSTTRRPRPWRSRPTWSRRWARNGTSPTSTTRGASRPATPTSRRSRRTAASTSAAPASRSAPPT